MLDANFYLDARTREKRLRLQGKCQLAELPSAGITWETDDNGFVVAARGKETTATYRYDSEGYPTGKTTVAKNERFTVVSTPAKDPRKKLDYTATSTFNDRQLGTCVKPAITIATTTRLIASCRWSMKASSRRDPLYHQKQYRILLSRGLQQRLALGAVFGQYWCWNRHIRMVLRYSPLIKIHESAPLP
jgi:hypothetical protein